MWFWKIFLGLVGLGWAGLGWLGWARCWELGLMRLLMDGGATGHQPPATRSHCNAAFGVLPVKDLSWTYFSTPNSDRNELILINWSVAWFHWICRSDRTSMLRVVGGKNRVNPQHLAWIWLALLSTSHWHPLNIVGEDMTYTYHYTYTLSDLGELLFIFNAVARSFRTLHAFQGWSSTKYVL